MPLSSRMILGESADRLPWMTTPSAAGIIENPLRALQNEGSESVSRGVRRPASEQHEPWNSVCRLLIHFLPFVGFRIEDPQVGQVARYEHNQGVRNEITRISEHRFRPTFHSSVMEPAVEHDVLLPERHSANGGHQYAFPSCGTTTRLTCDHFAQ